MIVFKSPPLLHGVLAVTAARGQAFPQRTEQIVVPYTMRIGAGLVSRNLGPRLAERWKVGVITDKRPGATGSIGTEFVAKAAANGHMLLMTATSFGTAPAHSAKLPFDPLASFSPVIQIAASEMTFVLHPQLPVKSMQTLIDFAKRRSGQLLSGVSGNNGPQHLAAELIKPEADINIVHVPYRGAAGAMVDLIGGHVQATLSAKQTVALQARANKVRVLAEMSEKRSAAFPDVLTMVERQLPNLLVATWYGLFAPSAKPQAAVTRLNQDINALLQQADVREPFARQSMNTTGGSPVQFGAMVTSELKRWARVVAAAKIKAGQRRGVEDVFINDAGIGDLALHRAGIGCRIYESVPEIKPLGVGINILPHASRELIALGLEAALCQVAVITRESCFYNRYGQYIYSQPAGLDAGYDVPQFSIPRGDLQMVLLHAFIERAGKDKVSTGHQYAGAYADQGIAQFVSSVNSAALPSQTANIIVSAEDIPSAEHKQFYPQEGPPKYSDNNMWRGVTRWKPMLSGASRVRIGWHPPAKLLLYPIRNATDDEGRQIFNWIIDIEIPEHAKNDWNRPGDLNDFIPTVADWRFERLDMPQFICSADAILEYRMVDQDPLPRWNHGCVTLLGNAAHPKYPRRANGAAQSMLDACIMADALKADTDPLAGLATHQSKRLPATRDVVLVNRSAPPDAILHEVFKRTNDHPFKNIDDVISHAEIMALSERYKRVAGYDKERMQARR